MSNVATLQEQPLSWSRLGAAVGVLTLVAVLSGLQHWEGIWKFAELTAATLALVTCLWRARLVAGILVAAMSVLPYICTRSFYDPGTQGPGMDLLALLINFVTLCACLALVVPPRATGARSS